MRPVTVFLLFARSNKRSCGAILDTVVLLISLRSVSLFFIFDVASAASNAADAAVTLAFTLLTSRRILKSSNKSLESRWAFSTAPKSLSERSSPFFMEVAEVAVVTLSIDFLCVVVGISELSTNAPLVVRLRGGGALLLFGDGILLLIKSLLVGGFNIIVGGGGTKPDMGIAPPLAFAEGGLEDGSPAEGGLGGDAVFGDLSTAFIICGGGVLMMVEVVAEIVEAAMTVDAAIVIAIEERLVAEALAVMIGRGFIVPAVIIFLATTC